MATNINSFSGYKDLLAIASQAYGHGLGEKSAGGMGYMGLIKDDEGKVSVFKCLTHKSEYKAFERGVIDAEYTDALRNASDQLKTELRKLAMDAGMEDKELGELFDDSLKGSEDTGKFLSRKMVAKAVTSIVKAYTKGKNAAAFWNEVKYSGYVENTKVTKGDDGLAFEDAKAKSHKSDLSFTVTSKAEAAEIAKMPKTLDDLGKRLEGGKLGKELGDIFYQERCYFQNNIPKLDSAEHTKETKSAFDSMEPWVFDDHANEAFGERTLADPNTKTGWARMIGKLFQFSLKDAFEQFKETTTPEDMKSPHFMERATRTIMLQALVRTYCAAASLETSFAVAKLRKLHNFFTAPLLSDKPLASGSAEVAKMDRILKEVTQTIDQQCKLFKAEGKYDFEAKEIFSGGKSLVGSDESIDKVKKEIEEKNKVLAEDKKMGQYDINPRHILDKSGEMEAFKRLFKIFPNHVYSAVKTIDTENVNVESDEKKTVCLSDEKTNFSQKGAFALGPNENEFVNTMFAKETSTSEDF